MTCLCGRLTNREIDLTFTYTHIVNCQVDYLVYQNDRKDVSRCHMTCQILDFHRTHEVEQGISFVFESIKLANLDDKSKPSEHLTYFMWLF